MTYIFVALWGKTRSIYFYIVDLGVGEHSLKKIRLWTIYIDRYLKQPPQKVYLLLCLFVGSLG